jgi:hypothetical protein
MITRLENAFHSTVQALGLIFNDTADVAVGWLVIGVVLHVLANAVRQKGWFAILRAAYPNEPKLRLRDVEAAYFAGSGINAVIPARGGDALKVMLLHRRMDDARFSTIAATFLPETLFETAFGIGLVIWALSRGFLPVPVSPSEIPSIDVSFVIRHPFITAASVAAIVAAIYAFVRWLRREGRPLLARLRDGLAIFSSPRDYFLGVVPWQALGRLIRLGSLAAFMEAFKLPVTISTAVLVMAAQGGGRIIPIAPISAGLRLAMLSYGFVEVTGKTVDIAEITAFTVGVSVVLLVVGLVISLVILFKVLGTLNPRHAVRAARAALAERRAGGPGTGADPATAG